MRWWPALAAAAALAAILWLAPCGGPSPEEQIEAVVVQGGQAVQRQDARALCDLLTEAGKRWAMNYMERVRPQSCEAAARAGLARLGPENRARIGRMRAVRISIIGDQARAWIAPRIVNGIPQPIPFTRTPRGWKAG